MILKELQLTNFRNYSSLKINFSPNVNIICGNNAQGKTNLIESIYILGLVKSHRTSIDNSIIKSGMDRGKIKGVFEKNKIKTKYEVILENQKKILKINNLEVKKLNEYLNNNINIIIFYPQDLKIVQGSPEDRRDYLNIELGQLSNNYLKILLDYNKLLKIRNDYLKKMNMHIKVDLNYFDIITNYLIDKAIIICKMRNKFINELNLEAEKIFFDITNKSKFTILYKTNFYFKEEDSKKIMFEKYKENLEKEINIGSTLLGPHRDDLQLLLENSDLKYFGSQGQQKIAVLSMKLSEIEIFKKYKETKPLILLDDVFSELDNIKKKNIVKYLQENIQVIITTTDLKSINKKICEKARIFKIKNGNLENIEEVEK